MVTSELLWASYLTFNLKCERDGVLWEQKTRAATLSEARPYTEVNQQNREDDSNAILAVVESFNTGVL